MNMDKIKFKRQPERFIDGKPLFIPNKDFVAIGGELKSGLINKLKTFFKKIPWLYSFIFYFIAPAFFVGKPPKSIFRYLPEGGVVADIGSGDRRLRKDVINVDVYPWQEVDILADAHDLPFADSSSDGIVCTWVLEHMRDPSRVAKEFHRVLRPGGHLYLSTNFVLPYHPSPKDYYRWTAEGLRELFSDFEMLELKTGVGPTCAFLSVLQEWVSLALSFNIKILKDLIWILMVILTAPFKILDLVLARYAAADNIAAGLYFIAKKK